jgi:hypothetical protein
VLPIILDFILRLGKTSTSDDLVLSRDRIQLCVTSFIVEIGERGPQRKYSYIRCSSSCEKDYNATSPERNSSVMLILTKKELGKPLESSLVRDC